MVLFFFMAAVGGVGLWYKFHVVPRLEYTFSQSTSAPAKLVGVWMDHAWVDGEKTDAEIRSMYDQLRRSGVTDAYFHVGPLDHDGALPPTKYNDAARLLRLGREEYPTLRVWAWVGQVTTLWGGGLDLTSKATQETIVRDVMRALDLDFYGVHLNIEPVLSGDDQFLALLSSLSDGIGDTGKGISVAADDLEPFFGAGYLVRQCCGQVTFWTPAYLAKVLGFVDQVVVMTYDSQLKDPFLYSWYVSMETRRLLSLLPQGKEILVGIPSFETGNRYFDPKTENIISGLRGVLDGLDTSHLEGKNDRFGIAIYAYWETSQDEWKILRDHWRVKDN